MQVQVIMGKTIERKLVSSSTTGNYMSHVAVPHSACVYCKMSIAAVRRLLCIFGLCTQDLLVVSECLQQAAVGQARIVLKQPLTCRDATSSMCNSSHPHLLPLPSGP
jgi:hypothetical protein